MYIGIIEKINIDGYERMVKLKLSEKDIVIWGHLIQHDEYLMSGESKKLNLNDKINCNLHIDLVSSYVCLNSLTSLGFEQPIEESSHIIVKAKVIKISDDYTIICDIGLLGKEIKVGFEEKVNLEVGQKIKFSGSLEIEIM